MATTDTSNHDKLRRALLQLHKALLDAQRVRYERVNGEPVAMSRERIQHVRVKARVDAKMAKPQGGFEVRNVRTRLLTLVMFGAVVGARTTGCARP